MASSPITSWQIMGKQWKQWETLLSEAPKSLQMVIAVMKLKDSYSLEGKLWQPRQHILKQRYYFANKGPSSQGYGFSSVHVSVQFSSFQFNCSVMSDSLWPHESQHARPPCPSPAPGVHSDSCPLSLWCHPAISSSVIPFSSCPQSLPAPESFPMSQLFASGGQSIGVSASTSVLPMNMQDWFPLGWTGWISLQSKGLSRVFSNITVQKHQFFGTQLSL